jgi:hypothetical protein
MKVEQLSKHERLIVMHAIRQFGTGGHAMPDEQNIIYFTPQYASLCLRRTLQRAILNDIERQQIAEIALKLSD